MNKVNKIMLTRREYPNKDDLYAAVSQQIRILLESGYVLVVNMVDEKGDCIEIEYSTYHTDADWPRPFWLVENEMMSAANAHIDNEVNKSREIIESADRANSVVEAYLNKIVKKDKGGDGGNNGFDA